MAGGRRDWLNRLLKPLEMSGKISDNREAAIADRPHRTNSPAIKATGATTAIKREKRLPEPAGISVSREHETDQAVTLPALGGSKVFGVPWTRFGFHRTVSTRREREPRTLWTLGFRSSCWRARDAASRASRVNSSPAPRRFWISSDAAGRAVRKLRSEVSVSLGAWDVIVTPSAAAQPCPLPTRFHP